MSYIKGALTGIWKTFITIRHKGVYRGTFCQTGKGLCLLLVVNKTSIYAELQADGIAYTEVVL